MKIAKGFTLVELVIVIILIGTLAATVLPKFFASDPFEASTFRTSFISALRLAQQRAMQQTNTTYCHQIVIAGDGKRYGVPDRTDCSNTLFGAGWSPDATGLIMEDQYNTTFSINGETNPVQIGFNGLGVPTGDCAGGCIIDVASTTDTVQIQIEPQGYIHAL